MSSQRQMAGLLPLGIAAGCAVFAVRKAGALRVHCKQQQQRELQLHEEIERLAEENQRLADGLQTARSHIDGLEVGLRQEQEARSNRLIALHSRQARWGHFIDKVQRMLDRINPHGSDAQFLSRVLLTARTKSVEALLEQQAISRTPTELLGLLWKQSIMNEVDWFALAESPQAAAKQFEHVPTFEDWLCEAPEKLCKLQQQWGSFETMRHVGPHLPRLAGAMSGSDMVLEWDLEDLEDLEDLMAAAPALPEQPVASGYRVADDWDAQVVGPADQAAAEWEVNLVGPADQAAAEWEVDLVGPAGQAANGWEDVLVGPADRAAEEFETELLAAAAALPELVVAVAAEEEVVAAEEEAALLAAAAALPELALALAAEELKDELLGAAAALPELAVAMAAEERDALLVRERDALLLAVRLQDLAIKQAIRLAVHSECLTTEEATQQQAIMQQIQVVAAGVGAPAFLIQQLDAVAIVQQQAAGAHIKQLAGGALTQPLAAAALVAQIVDGALQHAEEARHQQQAAAVVAVQQQRHTDDLAQAQHEQAQLKALLAATQAQARRLLELTRAQRETANARAQTREAELAQEQAVGHQLADRLAQEQAVPVVDPRALDRGRGRARLISQGSYGAVYQWWVKGYGAVAVKLSLPDPNAIRAEATINRRILPNPYIAQSYGLSHAPGIGWVMMMEHLDGTLDTAPRLSDGTVGRVSTLRVLHDVASGMHHLHSHNLVHCDLKSNNIGFHYRYNGQRMSCVFKVIDFGNSVSTGQDVNIVGGLCGPYMTPEMAIELGNGVYPFPPDTTFPADPARDVWALGATVIEMAVPHAWAGRAQRHRDWNNGADGVAYDMAMELLRAQTGHGLNIDWALVESKLKADVTGIVRRCLSLSPADRPTMEQIVLEIAPIFVSHLVS